MQSFHVARRNTSASIISMLWHISNIGIISLQPWCTSTESIAGRGCFIAARSQPCVRGSAMVHVLSCNPFLLPGTMQVLPGSQRCQGRPSICRCPSLPAACWFRDTASAMQRSFATFGIWVIVSGELQILLLPCVKKAGRLCGHSTIMKQCTTAGA